MSATPPDELVYFLHIPKTAGTSLLRFISRAVGPDRAVNVLWDHVVDGTHGITERTRAVSGHLGGLFPLWLRRWPRVITVLRDPVARALSHVNHVQRDAAHPLHARAAGLSVEEYCAHPALRRTVDNFQSRYLASLSFADALLPEPVAGRPFGVVSVAHENALYALDAGVDLLPAAIRAVDRVDAVGVCEALAPSQQLFARVLGWAAAADEQWENRAAEGQRTLAGLSDRERDTLARLNAIDAEVYRHARARFQQLCRQHGVELSEVTRARLAAA